MGLRALRYGIESSLERPTPWRIDPQTPATFSASVAGARPAAFLLRNEDLTELARHAALAGTIVDRGMKHPAKGLSMILLRCAGIPLVRGRYHTTGRLDQSIRILLKNARNAQEWQVYLVGANSEIFEALWARAHSQIASVAPSPVLASMDGAEHDAGAAEILLVLPRLDVPEELERRLVGSSPSMQLARQLILLAAQTDEPVLILGDTGTGKEVVARSIHEFGPRPAERFTAVNCGAIPSELLESELFGHVRGAFTSAGSNKEGLWKSAGRGTLFLDEIGDLRLDHQAKVLRALQEGTIRAVGGRDELRVHARVIAATNRNLYAMVRAGEFRADLYFRLRSFFIRAPSLSEHRSDIPALAQFFWKSVRVNPYARLPTSIVDELTDRPWPGNARELRAVLAHLNSLFPNEEPRLEHLHAVFRLQGHAFEGATIAGLDRRLNRARNRELLLRLEDVVRACRATLEPLRRRGPWLSENGARVRDALRLRLEELRALSYSEAGSSAESPALPARVLNKAHVLRRSLVDLAAELEVDAEAARRRWRRDVRSGLDEVMALLEREMRGIDQG